MDVQASQNPIAEEIMCALKPAYARASMLKITKAEAAKLTKPFPDSAVEIRPDGAIYIPHIFLSERLNKTFGPGSWTLDCMDHWEDESTGTVYGEHYVLIRGCFIAKAMGERKFTPKEILDGRTRYSDALETTGAEALRRITGKRLSVGNQVWEPQFREKWKAKFAETYQGEDGELYWRRKGSAIADAEFGAPKAKDAGRKDDIAKRKKLSADQADNARHIMIQLLCSTFSKNHVMNFALAQGILKAGQTLDEWPEEKLVIEEWEIKKLLADMEAFMQGNKPKTGWQEFVIPFGKNKGKTLHDLNKRQLKEYIGAVPADKYPEFANALAEAEKHYKRKA